MEIFTKFLNCPSTIKFLSHISFARAFRKQLTDKKSSAGSGPESEREATADTGVTGVPADQHMRVRAPQKRALFVYTVSVFVPSAGPLKLCQVGRSDDCINRFCRFYFQSNTQSHTGRRIMGRGEVLMLQQLVGG